MPEAKLAREAEIAYASAPAGCQAARNDGAWAAFRRCRVGSSWFWRTLSVNARYPEEPPLLLDISLHRGEVFYGNVGAGRRLDFTVIGPAVNEASRIETMCGVLDQPLLMSEQFALCCGHPVVSLGRYDLRGVMSKQELFCPA